MYYCGWDGGGTKTRVAAVDETKALIAQADFGSLNPNGEKRETVARTIGEIVRFMDASLPGGLAGCGGLTVGMAGISNQASVAFVRETIAQTGLQKTPVIVGDQEIALYGAIRGAGCVLIAGTGSVCCGRNEAGTILRTGGYGYLIDDPGSGYAIGRDILTAVVRAADGRGKGTALTELTLGFLGLSDIGGLITWLYTPSHGKKEVASLAPLLKDALFRGDEAAAMIAGKAAAELAELVTALWRRLRLDRGEVAMAGGIIAHFPEIRRQTVRLLQSALPVAGFHAPYDPPAEGAARMAWATERAARGGSAG